jgi:hypothetical protein
LIMHVSCTWSGRSEVGQIVFKVQYEQIAWLEPQCRRLSAVGRQITIASRSIGLSLVVNGKIDLQHAITTAKVLRLWHHAPGFRPLAEIYRRVKRLGRATRSQANREEACANRQPTCNATSVHTASPPP